MFGQTTAQIPKNLGATCNLRAVAGGRVSIASGPAKPPLSEARPNPSLERDLHRHGTWPAKRSLSSCASRAKRHPGVGPSAQTLGLEGDTVTASGLLRGFVVNSVDPLRRRRLLVSVSTLPELGTTWALTCVPQGSRAIPKVGTTVWLMFEQEQPTSLVWLGVLPKAA